MFLTGEQRSALRASWHPARLLSVPVPDFPDFTEPLGNDLIPSSLIHRHDSVRNWSSDSRNRSQEGQGGSLYLPRVCLSNQLSRTTSKTCTQPSGKLAHALPAKFQARGLAALLPNSEPRVLCSEDHESCEQLKSSTVCGLKQLATTVQTSFISLVLKRFRHQSDGLVLQCACWAIAAVLRHHDRSYAFLGQLSGHHNDECHRDKHCSSHVRRAQPGTLPDSTHSTHLPSASPFTTSARAASQPNFLSTPGQLNDALGLSRHQRVTSPTLQ